MKQVFVVFAVLSGNHYPKAAFLALDAATAWLATRAATNSMDGTMAYGVESFYIAAVEMP